MSGFAERDSLMWEKFKRPEMIALIAASTSALAELSQTNLNALFHSIMLVVFIVSMIFIGGMVYNTASFKVKIKKLPDPIYKISEAEAREYFAKCGAMKLDALAKLIAENRAVHLQPEVTEETKKKLEARLFAMPGIAVYSNQTWSAAANQPSKWRR